MVEGFYKVEPQLIGHDIFFIVRDPWGREVSEIPYKKRTDAERVALLLDICNGKERRYYRSTSRCW